MIKNEENTKKFCEKGSFSKFSSPKTDRQFYFTKNKTKQEKSLHERLKIKEIQKNGYR